jgi:hypothetical protein
MHRTMYSPVCALPKRRGREISSGILRGGAQRGLLADQRLVYTCTTTPRVTRLYLTLARRRLEDGGEWPSFCTM